MALTVLDAVAAEGAGG